jgi:ABC-type multidrug transport system ATPase subunit
MLYEISEVCDKVALINYGEIIGFDTVENLALKLRTNVLNCILLTPISPEHLGSILARITEKLNPYLDQNLDPTISMIPVRYKPEKQELKIFYDGKAESRGEILKILIKHFESEFTVISFAQSKTSQLEMVYSEMMKDNSTENTKYIEGVELKNEIE